MTKAIIFDGWLTLASLSWATLAQAQMPDPPGQVGPGETRYMTHAGWMNGPVCLAPLRWHDGLDNAPSSVAPANKN